MSLSIALDGNLLLQLTPESRPQSIPVKFATSYTKKVMYDFTFLTSQSHVAAPQGSVTSPKIVIIWIDEGTVDFSWDSMGANPTSVSANPTPPPEDTPVWILMRYAPGAGQLYLSCTGPAKGRLWLFE
jgi:hypothetical protein